MGTYMIQIATFRSLVRLLTVTLTFHSSAQGDRALSGLPLALIFLNLQGLPECQRAQSKALALIAWELSSVILVSLTNPLHSLKRAVEHPPIHLRAWLVLLLLKTFSFSSYKDWLF